MLLRSACMSGAAAQAQHRVPATQPFRHTRTIGVLTKRGVRSFLLQRTRGDHRAARRPSQRRPTARSCKHVTFSRPDGQDLPRGGSRGTADPGRRRQRHIAVCMRLISFLMHAFALNQCAACQAVTLTPCAGCRLGPQMALVCTPPKVLLEEVGVDMDTAPVALRPHRHSRTEHA